VKFAFILVEKRRKAWTTDRSGRKERRTSANSRHGSASATEGNPLLGAPRLIFGVPEITLSFEERP
jgi:hypothetical protein